MQTGSGLEAPTPVLWGVDPKEAKLRPSTEALANVRQFLGGNFSAVHPVYICGDDEVSLEAARADILAYLRPLELGPTAEPTVYRSPSGKRSEWVERFLNVAHGQKSQLVLLTSHGRSTLGAIFLGSFAYELLQKSTVPVLFMNPHQQMAAKKDRVLFASDFSAESKVAFIKFLKLVEGKVSEVILLHVVSMPIQAMSVAQASGVMVPLPPDFIEEQKEWAAKETEHWIEEARKLNVSMHFEQMVTESWSSPVATIEKVAMDKHVGLVGLASHIGPIAKLAVGSVAQDLLNSQKFNLWICGPKGTEKN